MPFFTLITLFSVALTVSALPLNGNRDSLQFRRDDRIYSFVPRDQAGQCQNLTSDQVQTLPGFDKIAQFAEDNFGTGKHRIVTNDPDFPDSPAILCVAPGPATVTLDPPSCTTTFNNVTGEQSTDGSISFSVEQGTSSEGSWSVTKSTSTTDSASFGVDLGIPEIGLGLSAGGSVSTTVENSLSQSFSTSSNSTTTTKLSFKLPNHNSCSLAVNTTSCTAQGTGQIRLLASGFVWFEYDDKRVAISDPDGGSHFKYNVEIESVLTNQDDRSAFIGFGGKLNVVNKVSFKEGCEVTATKAPKKKGKKRSLYGRQLRAEVLAQSN